MEYQNVLMELYKYQTVLDSMMNDKPPYNELQKNYEELKHRHRLYNAIDDLKESYHEVVSKKVINKIEESIKL